MPRKEQITITLDPTLVERLRDIAKKRNSSLSSVIESYLFSVDSLTGKTDIQRVLEILSDIKSSLATEGKEIDLETEKQLQYGLGLNPEDFPKR